MSVEEAFRALNSKSVAKTKAVESKTAVKKKKLIEAIEDDIDYAECIPEDMTQFFSINEEDNTNPNEYMPKNSYRGYKAVANLIACGDYADELRDCGYEYALLIADSADSFFVGYVAGDRIYELTEEDIYDQIGVNYDNDNDEMLTEATKKQLDSFAVKVRKELGGNFKVVGNSRTQCADILDNEENIIGQAYPKFRTIEIEKPITVKRLIHIKSVDEIQPDDVIYVKRSENSNMKKVADQIDYIKMVHGIVDSADAFIASVNKANDTDDLAMNTDNRN